MKLTRINAEQIHKLWLKIDNPFIPTWEDAGCRIVQAQLEACEKEAQEKVRQIFEELSAYDACYCLRAYNFLQALKQKHLED